MALSESKKKFIKAFIESALLPDDVVIYNENGPNFEVLLPAVMSDNGGLLVFREDWTPPSWKGIIQAITELKKALQDPDHHELHYAAEDVVDRLEELIGEQQDGPFTTNRE